MLVFDKAGWITPASDLGDNCAVFHKQFSLDGNAEKAILYISALGLYEAKLNGRRVGKYLFTPGWTSYRYRVQYQEYDVTDMLAADNTLEITLGKGWCFGSLNTAYNNDLPYPSPAVICELDITCHNGSKTAVFSGESFLAAKSNILYSDIYHGEIYDSRDYKKEWVKSIRRDYPKDILVPHHGEFVCEMEEIEPVRLITTEQGDRIIDFGQNLTGYVRFKTKAPRGTVLELSHAETLDKHGYFYTHNLLGAQQRITYIANGEEMEYAPHFTFQGFRYIKLDKWTSPLDLNDFKAIAVHSEMRRTGFFECSNEKVNKLFNNVIWSQKGNFLDVPTDCPQRSERLGWTGDAQVFTRAASYNFNIEKFYSKWLKDLATDQFPDGGVSAVVPNVLGEPFLKNWSNSSAWGDAAVICPWRIYLTYGNIKILADQFDSMKKWVDYVRAQGDDEFIWNTGFHFGDWLERDISGKILNFTPMATPSDLIATAYYAYSVGLLIKAGRVLKKDMPEYERLYEGIVSRFQREFIKDGKIVSKTQSAHVLPLYFDLCGPYTENIASSLAEMVKANGNRLTTGFYGTAYLLHVLARAGYGETAYDLLLQEACPSWLYTVNKGATTIWERWDCVGADGEFCDVNSNSFNHYANGAVADWLYGVAAGINIDENAPGFENVIIKPLTDKRLSYVFASVDTKFGKLSSNWRKAGDRFEYKFEVPNKGTIYIGDKVYSVGKGVHVYA